MTNEQLSHTQFNLGAGNDTLVVDKNVTADIHANGGAGNDAMVGGGGNNYFDGGSGKDLETHRIIKVNLDGKVLGVLSSFGKAPGRLDVPHYLALDSTGAIYVAEVRNWRLQKFVKD
jgi:Ca2+-binding RTX toxin-like protein